MKTVELSKHFGQDQWRDVEAPVEIEIDNELTLEIPISHLHRHVRLALADPSRVHEQTVSVPVTWLIGERVGY